VAVSLYFDHNFRNEQLPDPPAGQPPDLSEIADADFSRGVRNPYLVLLAPDVWPLFPTEEAANAALRAYAREHGLDQRSRPTHTQALRRLTGHPRNASNRRTP
jgi:hypothetical protein